MKKFIMIVIAAAIVLPAMAQNLTQPRDPAIQSQKIMTTGATYNGTVYEPFSNTTPAEYNPVSSSPAQAPAGPRRLGNFDNLPEGGDQENSYPIGDAVLPLLLLVLAYLSTRVFLKKRALKG